MNTIDKKTSSAEESFNPEHLSPLQKIELLLKIFDLGNNPDKNKERRSRFIDLMGAYNHLGISSKIMASEAGDDPTKNITTSDKHKKELHDKIMSSLLNASLSRGIPLKQKALLDYLARNRGAVEDMITAYFSPQDSARPTTESQIYRGPGPFFRKPGEED